jgi:hypothetical protein
MVTQATTRSELVRTIGTEEIVEAEFEFLSSGAIATEIRSMMRVK